ncbi:hypothetical protein NE237_032724 [Protea cynaroides]|uniref:Uncharacterized protein n=1 Tax=Protea cynaroides TaxID=273540 RepID=A0A9Q0L3V0_9MAGN|nr:hypothetical protein NE237_032724 [Protea cynaroides]
MSDFGAARMFGIQSNTEINIATSSTFGGTTEYLTPEGIHTWPMDLAPLASMQDFSLSLSVGEGDDDYHSSDEEREEVAWLVRKISYFSSGDPRLELFVEDSLGIDLTMDWDEMSKPEDAIHRL